MRDYLRRGDVSRQSQRARPRGSATGRWRPVLLLAVLLAAASVGVAATVERLPAGAGVLTADPAGPSASSAAPDPTVSPGPVPSPSAADAVPSPSAVDLASVLQLTDPVPATGWGTFGYDVRAGATLGRSGAVQRYRVAVEDGSGEDVRAFSDEVQQALTGPGSWVDSGLLRLRRVPGGSPAEFTVFLATAGTAGRMCLAGGVDIRVGAWPYTSCRAPGQVIINLDRWRTSVPHFVRAGVPLRLYRLYVVNHEVGHQLGHHHEGCPGAGRPAPVMQQQSLFLGGCTPNPWPYLAGRRYSGPPL